MFNTWKRTMVWLLIMVLVIGMLPFAAFAAGELTPVNVAHDFCTLVKIQDQGGTTWSEGFPWLATVYCDGAQWEDSDGKFTTITTSGSWLYCIEYSKHAGTALNVVPTYLNETQAWKNLSDTAKKGITHALIYGGSHYSNEFYGYAATQLIIWEYQLDKRESPTDTPTYFEPTLSKSPRLRRYYNDILARIKLHETYPSFHNAEVKLTGYGKENGCVLTDTVGVLQYDAWQQQNGQNIAVEQNGNDLLIYAKESFQPGTTETITLERPLKSGEPDAVCLKAKNQTCVKGTPPDPLIISIDIKMENSTNGSTFDFRPPDE